MRPHSNSLDPHFYWHLQQTVHSVLSSRSMNYFLSNQRQCWNPGPRFRFTPNSMSSFLTHTTSHGRAQHRTKVAWDTAHLPSLTELPLCRKKVMHPPPQAHPSSFMLICPVDFCISWNWQTNKLRQKHILFCLLFTAETIWHPDLK